MLRILCLGALALWAGALSAAEPGPAGRVRVVDGDTLAVGGVKVRLHGIDAPELDQICGAPGGGVWACGEWAAARLQTLAGGRNAVCTMRDIDRYGRVVATCAVGGSDLGATLVRDGAALAYRRYSTAYVAEEALAVKARLGIWSGDLVAPEQARRMGRPEVSDAAAPEGCRIKGNVSASGRIYHLPGQEFYDRTRISPERGERWFCDEAEARAAGWRRARR